MTARSRRSSRYLGRVTAAQLDRAGTPYGPQTVGSEGRLGMTTMSPGNSGRCCSGPPTVAASEFVTARARGAQHR